MLGLCCTVAGLFQRPEWDLCWMLIRGCTLLWDTGICICLTLQSLLAVTHHPEIHSDGSAHIHQHKADMTNAGLPPLWAHWKTAAICSQGSNKGGKFECLTPVCLLVWHCSYTLKVCTSWVALSLQFFFFFYHLWFLTKFFFHLCVALVMNWKGYYHGNQ